MVEAHLAVQGAIRCGGNWEYCCSSALLHASAQSIEFSVSLTSSGADAYKMCLCLPFCRKIQTYFTLLNCRSYQVRGHLAAKIDPIGLNNMDADKV